MSSYAIYLYRHSASDNNMFHETGRIQLSMTGEADAIAKASQIEPSMIKDSDLVILVSNDMKMIRILKSNPMSQSADDQTATASSAPAISMPTLARTF
ncbi:hypothetical protein LOK46_13400 [Methylobacterium sp. NMS14P]|uniref:hypothetical protein n=1 Tax=Methylobacterium sp. NMS14P TaxID=2894310 RepID=UPI00235987FC|nr:hypothetical protein [Methylobacterium sp. NMS14P]WCS27770.1 hypothetical protein LOK46_13400 [Methylobacterium sp. NMS14P]